jgi:hypothetical protein
MTKTDEGYLVGKAVFTRTGIFQYQRADGSIYNELRTSEEVFSQDSINSFKLKPVTNNHPEEKVDVDNIKNYQVGNIGEDLKRDGSNLVGSVIITDSQTIKDIENGKRELSLGYTVELIKEDGEFEGQQYEFKQTNIRGNHLAIVYQARAGRQARLNLDGQDAVCVNNINNNNNKMSEKDNSKDLQSKIDTLEENKADLSKKIGEMQIKIDSLEGERDALKEKIDSISKKDNSEEIASLVKARKELEKTAESILNKDLSEKTDSEIMLEVIKENSELKMDGKSEEYIKATFDAVVNLKAKADDNLSNQNKLFELKSDSVADKTSSSLSLSDQINNNVKIYNLGK